jgi:rhodanese-related sulfurtransferase
MRRLQVNITRESKEDGKKIVDLSLKETGYGDQQKRKDGIQTEWLQAALARKEPLQMLDIRETEEVEMGVISGVRPVRFPDMMKEPELYLDKGKTVYLFCANGNRSCEMATFLAEKGYDSRFMIGGYEKWVAEERPLETPGGACGTSCARARFREQERPARHARRDGVDGGAGRPVVDPRYPATSRRTCTCPER